MTFKASLALNSPNAANPVSTLLFASMLILHFPEPVYGVTCQMETKSSFKLPPLPYGTRALEPFISEDTVNTHYHKHHQVQSSFVAFLGFL